MLTEQNGIQVDKFYAPVDWQYSFPEGYTRLEYLQSSGTQYIDTGLTANQDSRCVAQFETSSTTNQAVFCARNSQAANNFACLLITSFFRPCYGTIYTNTSERVSLNTKYTVDLNKNNFYINGTLIKTFDVATFSSSKNIIIGRSENTIGNYFLGKIYSCIIWNNGILISNFVPAKRNSDNKPGMYDLVNNVFYTNAGTGEFVMGPELYSNNSQIDIRQKNNTNFVEKYKFNTNNELIWANPQLNLSGPVGYTKVGNPTITDNVVSGFSSGNYLTLPNYNQIVNSIEIVFKINQIPITITNNALICSLNSDFSFRSFVASTKKVQFSYTDINNTTKYVASTNIITNNTYCKFILNQSGAFLYFSSNNLDWTLEYSRTEKAKFSIINNGRIGYLSNTYNMFDGSIDLKETYIKVNDKLWFYGKNYTSENYAPVPAGLNYNNTTTPSIGYVNTQTQVFTPVPTDGIKYSQTRDIKVIPPEDNTITLLYGTQESHHLPSEYTELEYIQSDGNAYINTGIILGNNFEVETTFTSNETAIDKPVFSSRVASGDTELSLFAPGGSSNKLQLKWGNVNVNLDSSYFNNTKYNVKTDGQNWYINGNLAHTFTNTTVLTQPLYITAVKNEGATTPNFVAKHKINFVRVKKDGSLIANFIPAKRNSDGEIGMYDTVYGVFYTNQGTGAFTAGAFKYGLFGLLANTSSGTYDVYIDDVLYATTTKNTQTDIDFSALGSEYVAIGTCTTPEELVLHKIVIKPTTSGETITAFRCARTSGISTNQQQGVLWGHFELENNIELSAAFGTGSNQYIPIVLQAVTAKNDSLNTGIISTSFRASSLYYLPKITNATNFNSAFRGSKLKHIRIRNYNGFGTYTYDNCTLLEKISINEVTKKDIREFIFNNNYNLKLLPFLSSTRNNLTQAITYAQKLYPTKIDITDNTTTKLGMYGSSTYPMRGLRGLKVSNEAPFTGDSPQINVSYTGLDRDALVELFNSMPGYMKLDKVGEPTIDSNGVVSGFSSSDYLKTQMLITSEIQARYRQSFEIQVKVTLPNSFDTEQQFVHIPYRGILNGFTVRTTGRIRWYIIGGSTYINSQTIFSANASIFIKGVISNEVATLYSSTDGENWITEGSANLSNDAINETDQPILFGVSQSISGVFNGSIDLKNSYIKINNARYQFQLPDDETTRAINITAATGNNLTLSGNATIDNNETLANVDSSSSCTSPTLPTEFRTMEMLFKVKYPNASSSSYIPIAGFGGTGSYRRIGGNGSTGHNLIYSSSVTLIVIPLTDFDFVEAAKNGYYVKLNIIKEGNNYRYKLSLSMDKIIWVNKEVVSEYNVCSGTVSLLRTISGAANGNPQMFLSDTYIKVDNNYIVKGYLTDNDRLIATNKGWTITG